jgi:N6-L-threonylcarbamoyladenine synthase
MPRVLVLGIETSCDETAAAVVRDDGCVLSSVIGTSQRAFAHLGGVIPEQAAREQVHLVLPVIEAALQQAQITPAQLDRLAVTRGPGLLGSLLVGTTTARVLSRLWQRPLVGVHHTLGHLASPWLHQPGDHPLDSPFPLMSLSVSGGHTELWLRTSHTTGTCLGRTRDDAAGEAFDKGATLLGLPYPGGPALAKAAQPGNPQAIAFPRPLHREPGCDFSFAGLKTALRTKLQQEASPLPPTRHADVAASYQHALCAHLCDRLERALSAHPEVQSVHLVGGVSANTYLRTLAQATAGTLPIHWPRTLDACTDNAAMIALAGVHLSPSRDWQTSNAIALALA